MQANQMSKSQRKKLRLIQRIRNGAQVAIRPDNNSLIAPVSRSGVSIVEVGGNTVPSKNTARNRRRRERRRQNRIGGRLDNAGNLYLRSLMDPENNPGAKIPDMVTFPSSTFQLTMDGVILPTMAGDGTAVVLCPFIGTGASQFPVYIGYNTVADDVYTWTNKNWSARAAVVSVYDTFRPVSAVLYGEYVGKSTDDSGQICMGILPRLPNNSNTYIPSFDTAIAQSFTKTIPLRNGAVVLWKPQDNVDLEYYASITDPYSNAGSFAPAIFFATQGQAVGAAIRYRCVVNFEAIPTSDTFQLVSPSPSPSDVAALSAAMNWAGQVYNNMSAFVNTVSPYVQPVLNSAFQAAAPLLGSRLGRSLIGGGNSLRIPY